MTNQPTIPKTLSDLIGSGVKVGDIIQWDGTTWVVQTPSWSLEKLSDVNVSGVTDGQVLTWDDANGEWIPTTPSFTQVNSDWNATSGVEEILNKPTIPSELRDLTDVNISSPVQNDTLIFDAPSNQFINGQLGAVAYSNDYNDLSNQPTIPSLTSELTNDSGFITIGDVPTQVQSDWTQTNTSALDYIKNKPTIPAVIGDMTKAVYDTDDDGIVDFAEALKTEVRNSTGAVLRKGYIIRLSGSTGNLPNAVLAKADAESTSAQTFGVVYEDIANNSNGFVITLGQIDTLDTRSSATNPFTSDTLVDGQVIYLSPTTAGYVTNVKPSAPNHIVYVGYVIRTSPTNGTIQYRIQNGYELDEIHDVKIVSPQLKNLLSYNSASTLWENKSIDSSWMNDRTSVGQALFGLPNPSAISYIRINADNSVSALTLAQLKSDLGMSRVVLSSDVSVTASAITLADITGLSFPIVAGSSYKFRAELYVTASSSNVGLRLSVNASVAVASIVFRAVSASSTESGQYIHNGLALDSSSGVNVGAIRSSNYATIEGILVANNTGTAIMRFGKGAANVGTLSIKANSTLEYQTI